MKCAYCDNEGKMSREHIIPKGFIDHMNVEEQSVWSDKAPARLIKGELTVKDVCADCNNRELSQLDDYALNLILKYNECLSISTKKIYFKYNYNMLVRWLLKICYNSARANDAEFDIKLYQKNVDYIMNRGYAESNITVFAIYMGSGCLSKEMAEHCYHLKDEREFEIDWFRIGPFRLTEHSTYYCASRCIIINSFAFFIVVSDKEYDDELSKIRTKMEKQYKNAVELSNNGKVWLKRDDKFFLDSWSTNRVLRDNFLEKRTKKKDDRFQILTLTKEEIENDDFSKLKAMSMEYMSNRDDLLDCYQKVILAIEGYENEAREPYQSRAFQNYFRKLFDDFPEIIWALCLDEKIITVQMMIWAYVNDNYTDDVNNTMTNIEANKNRSMQLLEKCFMAINKLVNKYAFDFSKNEDLTRRFQTVYSKTLGINESEKVEGY